MFVTICLDKKDGMIDLHLIKSTSFNEDMMLVSSILNWFIIELNTNPEYEEIQFRGYLVLYDETKQNNASALILCNGPDQKKIINLLQQPPDTYKEKYIACVVSEEPEPVAETRKSEDTEDEDDIEIAIEET